MRSVKILLSFVVLAYSTVSSASIQILSTRVILNAVEKEQSFVIRNVGESPSLVQIWLSNQNHNEMKIEDDLPLFITPPVGRINAGKRKVFRVFAGEQALSVLPQDRESVFWINALDIPEQDKESHHSNRVNLAFRTKIKLFYRPLKMKGTLIEAAGKLSWTKSKTAQGYEMIATNNSPFHITLANITLKSGDEAVATLPGEMIAPYSAQRFLFKTTGKVNASGLEYDYISDLGAFVNIKQKL